MNWLIVLRIGLVIGAWSLVIHLLDRDKKRPAQVAAGGVGEPGFALRRARWQLRGARHVRVLGVSFAAGLHAGNVDLAGGDRGEGHGRSLGLVGRRTL